MIIDGGKIEAETDLELRLGQELSHVFLNLIQAVHLLFVRQEHIRVNLVNEDFVLYVLVDAGAGMNDISELLAVALVVLWLSINHIDQSAAVLDGCYILW